NPRSRPRLACTPRLPVIGPAAERSGGDDDAAKLFRGVPADGPARHNNVLFEGPQPAAGSQSSSRAPAATTPVYGALLPRRPLPSAAAGIWKNGPPPPPFRRNPGEGRAGSEGSVGTGGEGRGNKGRSGVYWKRLALSPADPAAEQSAASKEADPEVRARATNDTERKR